MTAGQAQDRQLSGVAQAWLEQEGEFRWGPVGIN